MPTPPPQAAKRSSGLVGSHPLGASLGRGRRPGGLPGTAAEGGDDDEEDLEALLARLQAAALPPDVLKVALKELRRLKLGGDQQPGAASSR